MVELFIQSLAIIGIYATLWFSLSLYFRRNDIADIAWGGGYLVLILWFLMTRPTSAVAGVIYLLVAFWAIRLAIHIGWRLRGKPEDFRYRQWREEWGPHFYLRSFLQVYILQGLLLVIIAMPLMIAAHAGMMAIGWMTWVGIFGWVAGFLFQAVADRQLTRFVKHRQSKEEVLDTGLWRYSRHPNYFGEIVMWWSIFIMVFPLPGGWIGVVSPLMITWLLVFVSGVPMLEKRYADHPGYQAYRKKTSKLVPWWPTNG